MEVEAWRIRADEMVIDRLMQRICLGARETLERQCQMA
jgi:hypothetical protein